MDQKYIPCPVEGCERNAHRIARGCKGLCTVHYHRLKRHGDPLLGRTQNGEPMRFVQEVALPYAGDDCLTWPFSRTLYGYGDLWVDGVHFPAHRYICKVINGDPPSPDHEAAHSCGNGHEGCINPNHLSWKTPKQNQADRILHDTHKRGERSHLAKLTEDQAREALRLKGLVSQEEIAASFNVSRGAISHIHRGNSWAWIECGDVRPKPTKTEDKRAKAA